MARQGESGTIRVDGDLPLVLVVDDLYGAPELFEGRDGFAEARERAVAERGVYCRRFGLVPVDGPPVEVAAPVARARFVSGLRWSGPWTRLDQDLVINALETMRQDEPPGPALVLLDLRFDFGPWDEGEGGFAATSVTFGADVILPLLHDRYGGDQTSPGSRWTAVPVVVISDLPKVEVDEVVRTRGARGMLQKHGEGESPEECRRLLRRYLDDHGLLPDPTGRLVGQSLPFLNALAAARRAAARASSALVLGESGTGKELLARYIHDHSPHRDGPYRVFNAAGRGDELQEDELFGHWAGAYTGADRDRPGLLEEASGGTLFIDEIGDVGVRVQNALMRPLQERITTRMGRPPGHTEARAKEIDTLFVFATNKDLRAAVKRGEFKPDLLERIEEVAITLPPLRERPGDIPRLAAALLTQIDADHARRDPAAIVHRLDPGALAALERRSFADGNVRELRNLLLKVTLATAAEPRITAADVGGGPPPAEARAAEASLPEAEGEAPTPGPAATGLLRALAALERWLTRDPESLTVGQLAGLERDLRGAAPHLLVALLEASRGLATATGGEASLPRLMEHFWGCDKLTSQQARRALLRLLQVEWHEGVVARVARQSASLSADERLAKVIDEAAARWKGGGA